jgi:hypothetical protein
MGLFNLMHEIVIRHWYDDMGELSWGTNAAREVKRSV